MARTLEEELQETREMNVALNAMFTAYAGERTLLYEKVSRLESAKKTYEEIIFKQGEKLTSYESIRDNLKDWSIEVEATGNWVLTKPSDTNGNPWYHVFNQLEDIVAFLKEMK